MIEKIIKEIRHYQDSLELDGDEVKILQEDNFKLAAERIIKLFPRNCSDCGCDIKDDAPVFCWTCYL